VAAKKTKKKAFAGEAAPLKTPAAKRVAHESPLARLKRTGALNVWELTAADEIIAAFALSTGSPVRRDADLGIPASNPRPDAADSGAARRSDLSVSYATWCADLSKEVPGLVTVWTLLDELPLRECERRAGLRNGTGMAFLLQGLRHYAALRGNVPRSAVGWKWTGRKEAA
jgi:hypothetical protein